MKIEFDISDAVMAQLQREAARQGRTVSELVEMALRAMLAATSKLPPLPTFHCGEARVDVADHDALYDAMEDE